MPARSHPFASPTARWPDPTESKRIRDLVENDGVDVLITGPPGSGKSTVLDALRHLTADSARSIRFHDDVDAAHPGAVDDLVRHSIDGGPIVATARSVLRLPPPLAAFVADGRIEVVRLEFPPLDVLGEHLASLLGGPVDHASVKELRRCCAGDLRLLHRVVEDGRADGSLRPRLGVWGWSGEIVPGPATMTLVSADLRGRHPNEATVLELLALARPADSASILDTLDHLRVPSTHLDDLVADGDLIEDGPSGVLDLPRPIVTRAIRRAIPPGRRLTLLEALLTAEPPGVAAAHRVGRIRSMLRCGRRPDDDVLLEAARTAATAGENRIVIDLTDPLIATTPTGTAASPTGGDACGGRTEISARILRADAARILGRHDLARRDLAAVAARIEQTDDRDLRLAVARRRADLAQYVDDDPDTAIELLRAEAAGCDGSPASDEPLGPAVRRSLRIQAEITLREAWAGRFLTAIPNALDLLGRAELDPVDRHRLVTPVVLGLTAHGRFHEALGLLDRHHPTAEHLRIDERSPDVEFRSARFHLLLNSGRLGDAARVLSAAERADDREFPPLRQIGRGQLAVARGRPAEAVGHLRVAVESLRVDDPIGFLPFAVATASLAEAMAGHGPRARRLLDELPEIPLGTCRALEGDIELDRVRTAFVLGLPDAPDLIAALVERAERRGEALIELAARHLDAYARTRRPASPPPRPATSSTRKPGISATTGPGAESASDRAVMAVRRCAEAVEGPIGPALGHQAEALLRHPGRPAPGAATLASLGVPTFEPPRATALSPRQEEVARLAASGMTSRDIAAELFISVRTVDAHLRQVFRLLGVNRRGDLASALADPDPP